MLSNIGKGLKIMGAIFIYEILALASLIFISSLFAIMALVLTIAFFVVLFYSFNGIFGPICPR